MKIEQAMTSQIYKLWQDGETLANIAKECHTSVAMVRLHISKTPKERKCRYCGVIFVGKQGNRYCSKRCQINERYKGKRGVVNKPVEKKSKKQPVEPLHVVNERARAMGMSYGEYMQSLNTKHA